MIKNYLLLGGIILFLLLALTLNFVLQKDYFSEIGFAGWVITISIILLDGSKILSEIFFFKLKWGPSRISLGLFSILLLLLSAYTTFGVRQWKAHQAQLNTDFANSSVLAYNKRIRLAKQRLERQLDSLENQIQTKESMISALQEDDKGKWLRHRYNKEMTRLNNDKKQLIKQIEAKEAQFKPFDKKKVSLSDSLAASFGVSVQKLETATNIIVALTVEAIIIFLCYSLSYSLSNNTFKMPKFNFKRKKKLSGILEASMLDGNNGNNKVRYFFDNQINGDSLRVFRKSNNLTQTQLSELINVPRGTIAKLETGRGEITDELKKKLTEFETRILENSDN